jgi:hypothetical protein
MRGSQPLTAASSAPGVPRLPACGSSGDVQDNARLAGSPAWPPTICSATSITSIASTSSFIYLARRRGYPSRSCRSAGPTAAARACGRRRSRAPGRLGRHPHPPPLPDAAGRSDPRPGLDR